MKIYLKIIVVICFLTVNQLKAQNVKINGAVTLDVKVTFGNQNNLVQLGVSGFGISNYQKIAAEAGFSIYTGYMFQRHTIKKNGFINGYDVFYLLGYGQNNNLLGSTLSQYNKAVLFDSNNNNSFYGVGFGFEKQFLPEELKEFNQRIARLMMRFSKGNNSLGLSFKNDFKIGGLFYGDATDFGNTGSLYVNYTNAQSFDEIHQLGFAIELFTPKQDYDRIANNNINSDDGRKNVWYTTGNYKNTFYANAFVQYTLQKSHYVYQINTGMESNKLGAYIQNKLHDGFGLNPRFPWNVTRNNKPYVQGTIQSFINSL